MSEEEKKFELEEIRQSSIKTNDAEGIEYDEPVLQELLARLNKFDWISSSENTGQVLVRNRG